LVERRDPASEEQVAAAERLLEVRLPEQYRRFLVEEANGARPEQNLLHDDESGAGVDEYLGIDQSGDSDLVVVYETFRDRVPSWLLPVAHAPGGNLICLSLREEDRGTVWFWDHEQEAEEGDPPREDNLTMVAESFDEFASRLVAPDDADVPEPTVREVWVDPKLDEILRRQREQG
jgi:hypothetical protein